MSLIMNDDQDNHHILMTLVWALFLLTQSEKNYTSFRNLLVSPVSLPMTIEYL